MHAADLFLRIDADRRFGALKGIVAFVRENLVDGAHAVGALGMTGAGIVRGEHRMRQ